MYKEAFELIGKLIQNEKVIKEIVFTKKGFRVRWVSEKSLFHYKFIPLSIDSFIELYDIMEERLKKQN